MTRNRAAGGRSNRDLWVVVLLTLGAGLALLVPGVPRAIEWAVGIPFLLVLPGYALLAAVFGGSVSGPTAARQPDPPGWGAKAAMSLVTSAIVLGVLGVTLSTVGMLGLAPAVLTIGTVTLGGVVVARIRRRGVTVDTRPAPSSGESTIQVSSRSGTSGVQRVTLVIAILALVGAVAFAVTTPAQQSSFTEATLYAGPSAGELPDTEETTTLRADEENTVWVDLANHEGAPVDYEIVGQLQRVGSNGTVVEEEQVDRGQVRVEANETVRLERTIDPSMTGETLRLQYLIYKGAAPEDPGTDSADLSVHVWVEGVEGGST